MHCNTQQCPNSPGEPVSAIDIIVYSTAPYVTALHCTALHGTSLHCTALQHIKQHYTALHYTTLHCTVHYNTLQFTMVRWRVSASPPATVDTQHSVSTRSEGLTPCRPGCRLAGSFGQLHLLPGSVSQLHDLAGSFGQLHDLAGCRWRC